MYCKPEKEWYFGVVIAIEDGCSSSDSESNIPLETLWKDLYTDSDDAISFHLIKHRNSETAVRQINVPDVSTTSISSEIAKSRNTQVRRKTRSGAGSILDVSKKKICSRESLNEAEEVVMLCILKKTPVMRYANSQNCRELRRLYEFIQTLRHGGELNLEAAGSNPGGARFVVVRLWTSALQSTATAGLPPPFPHALLLLHHRFHPLLLLGAVRLSSTDATATSIDQRHTDDAGRYNAVIDIENGIPLRLWWRQRKTRDNISAVRSAKCGKQNGKQTNEEGLRGAGEEEN
nr:unnamed protein product [Callosobruchus chinensis]